MLVLDVPSADAGRLGDLGTVGGANAAVPRWGCGCGCCGWLGDFAGRVGFEGEPARGRLNVNGFGTVAGPGDLEGGRGGSVVGLGAVTGGGAENTLEDSPLGRGALKTLLRSGSGAGAGTGACTVEVVGGDVC